MHVAGDGGGQTRARELASASDREDIDRIFAAFLAPRPAVRELLAAQIRELIAALEHSDWFMSRAVVMASLLLVYDADPASGLQEARARIIDLTHCKKLEEGETITHRLPYERGNHEEGFLTGLDNLLSVCKGSG